MTFQLDQVVPWGRTFDEYVDMFSLTSNDLARSLLGCGDGPAAFNADLTAQGGSIVSCDPLYAFSTSQIKQRIDESMPTVLDQTEKNKEGFVWTADLPNVDALKNRRLRAMNRFLDDYPVGTRAGRYVNQSLPELEFLDGAFDLALCSHFLFLYDALGLEFHLKSVRSLIRVAREVRIFPLQQLDRTFSPFVNLVVNDIIGQGGQAEIIPVNYEFQRGSNQMLRLTAN